MFAHVTPRGDPLERRQQPPRTAVEEPEGTAAERSIAADREHEAGR
jgi:hypothetical protein